MLALKLIQNPHSFAAEIIGELSENVRQYVTKQTILR